MQQRHVTGCASLLCAEEGFSLIELLVAILAGTIVMFALFDMQITVLHQTTRVFTKVDATQRARVAIEGIENELHSACIVDNATPVQPTSTPDVLAFTSVYGAGATLTPVEHVITYSSSAGTLTESTYAEVSETTNLEGQPVYTWATTPTTTRTVLTNISAPVVSGTQTAFQYYEYSAVPNGSGGYYQNSAGEDYEMLLDGTNEVPGTTTIPAASPLPATPSLGSTNASNTAEVVITVTVGASGATDENTNESAADYNDSVQDGVVLRLTPAANHAGDGNVFLPCQ